VKTYYLDWSGDAGFKFRRGSSRYLTVACVHCDASVTETLSDLRQRHSLGRAFNFRFSQASEFIKPHFFSALGETAITGVVVRVDKTRLEASHPRPRGVEVLAFFAADTIGRLAKTDAENRALIYDGLKSERALSQALRVAISEKVRERRLTPFKHVSARPAKQHDGLQIADMLAGAAASRHLAENALLGRLQGKITLVDFVEGE
jgi:hypothetical protein